MILDRQYRLQLLRVPLSQKVNIFAVKMYLIEQERMRNGQSNLFKFHTFHFLLRKDLMWRWDILVQFLLVPPLTKDFNFWKTKTLIKFRTDKMIDKIPDYSTRKFEYKILFYKTECTKWVTFESLWIYLPIWWVIWDFHRFRSNTRYLVYLYRNFFKNT